MNTKGKPSFQAALNRYRQARAKIDQGVRADIDLERQTEKVDRALDALLAEPSPSLGAFGEKIGILKREYGLDAQRRHMIAIYADVAVLAAIYADSIFQAWPGS